MNVTSPCVAICELGDRDLCLGCFRKLDEIARWPRMTDDEKYRIIAALAKRRLKLTPDAPRETSNE